MATQCDSKELFYNNEKDDATNTEFSTKPVPLTKAWNWWWGGWVMVACSRTTTKGVRYHLSVDSFCTLLGEGMAGPKKGTNPNCWLIFTFDDLLVPAGNFKLF